MQRGLNSPEAQALRHKAEAATQNGAAKDEAPTAAEVNQLVVLFNAGRYVEMERQTRLLVAEYPSSGIVWKSWVLPFWCKEKMP